MIKITLDGQCYQGEPTLGTTLRDFLADQGLSPTEIVFDMDGRPLATDYTLAHSVQGQEFSLRGEVKEATSALTIDEIITATV